MWRLHAAKMCTSGRNLLSVKDKIEYLIANNT